MLIFKNLNYKNNLFIFSLLAYFFLFITNEFPSIDIAVNLGFSDQLQYYKILSSAPNLSGIEVNDNQAQRFILFYLIGTLIKFLKLSEYYYIIFLFLNIIIHISIIFLLIKIFELLRLNSNFSFLFLLIIILNPYIFRISLFAPLMINDQLFILGSLFLIQGLVKNNSIALIIGVSISSIARQTSMIFVPCLIIYMFFCFFGKEKQKLSNNFWVSIFISITLILFIFFFTKEYSNNFSVNDYNNLIRSITGIFKDNFSFKDLALFCAQIFIANSYLLFLIIIFLATKDFSFKLNRCFLIILLIGIGIFVQPILAGPKFTLGNVSRLTVLSLPFFLIFLYKVFPLKNLNLISSKFIYIFIFISSFHHNYSIFTFLNNFFYFMLITLIFLVNLVYILTKNNETKHNNTLL